MNDRMFTCRFCNAKVKPELREEIKYKKCSFKAFGVHSFPHTTYILVCPNCKKDNL